MADVPVIQSEASSSVLATEIQSLNCLSKRQRKKQLKRERCLANRQEKRKMEKLKRKLRHRREVEAGTPRSAPSRKQLKQVSMASSPNKQRLVVDMAYDDLMTDKDISKAVQQLSYCYSGNRRSPTPLQFFIANFNGKSRMLFDGIEGYNNWDVNIRREDYAELFPMESIVYLTSESPNTLEELDADKVYVIGGLVDHNHHKGLCLRLAEERGISHARLPIDKHLLMSTRKVLSINHVFEIILHYTESRDWRNALLKVIPKRKNPALKPSDQPRLDDCNGEKDSATKRDLKKNNSSTSCSSTVDS
ncbi:unnamed protein product [Soboliphyme baturini]|uniref:tRNA (guanine(9)-N(1))-methyltransferase n=1 Tax=Soboliphyme baturini TaxID=241478 RepID=A0A183IM86_9BILA|nr:unnamed protein product [Soboliphyme baturini]